jgi:hypothetical protein
MAFGDLVDHKTAEGSSAAPSVTLTAAPSSGDLVVVYILNNDNTSQTISDNTGSGETFAIALEAYAPNETARWGIFWKVAGASEPATYTFTQPNLQWRMFVYVFDGGAGVSVDLAPATNQDTSANADQDLICAAFNGRTYAANSLNFIFGGKDNRTGSEAYTTATQSFTNVLGASGPNQCAGAATRLITSGGTFSGNVVFTTADGTDGLTDATVSAHMSFVETSTGTTIEIPTGPVR